MRPSITEQLTIIRRILDEVVAPEVAADYPRRLLHEVLGHLDALAENWTAWQSELVAENDVLRTCLLAARPAAQAELVAAIDRALAAPVPDPLDHHAVCGLNETLRAATAGVIVAARTDAALAGPAAEIKGLLSKSVQGRT